MLRSTNSLIGYAIGATDGDLGKIIDFYFADDTWAIRYLVVKTGGWLSGRKVLLAPVALGEADWQSRTLHANLTMEQVRQSPELDATIPPSRQHERKLYGHYHWPVYWGSGMASGGMFMPSSTPVSFETRAPTEHVTEEPETGRRHLRSLQDVAGYHIEAVDGPLGHLDDCILDAAAWVVRYLVVDTANWMPGRKVLIAPQWITELSGARSEVTVDLTRQAIKGSPVYDPSQPVNTDYEGRLYDYYGRPRPPQIARTPVPAQ